MRVLIAIFTIPLLFFVPGYALSRSRFFDDIRISSLERSVIIIISSAAISSILALFLAEIGYFRIWLLDLLLVCCASIFFALRTRGRVLSSSGAIAISEKIIVVFLILLSVVLFFRPAEYVVGEGDPEYYYNIGYQLAESGSMNVYDKSLLRMTDFEISTFFNKGIVQFLPFHLRDKNKGKIQPLLYHLFPVWIALFIKMFGMKAGLFVSSLFGLLGVVSLYVFSRRFSNIIPSAICAFAFSFFFLQIWFSRIPVTEVFAAPFLLTGLVVFLEFRESFSSGSAFLCPLLFTVGSLARPEAFVFVVLLFFVAAFDFMSRDFEKSHRMFVNGLLAGSLILIVYIRFCALEYVTANFGKLLKFFGERASIEGALKLGAIMIVALFILFNTPALNRLFCGLGRQIKKRFGDFLLGLREFAIMNISIAIIFSSFYLYFSQRAKSIESAGERIFFNTASFMGGITIFAFIFALAFFLYDVENGAFAFVTGSGVLALLFASQESSLALGQYPWDSRRLMFFVIPILFVSASYLINRAFESNRVEFKTWAVLFACFFLIFFFVSSMPIFFHVENEGGIEQLKILGRKLHGSVVMFTGYYTGEVIGIPLRYTFGIDARRVFTMNDPWRFGEVIVRMTDSGKRVYLEMGGIDAGEIPYNRRVRKLLDFKPGFSEEIGLKRLKPVSSGIPKEIFTQRIKLHFYEIQPSKEFLKRIRKR